MDNLSMKTIEINTKSDFICFEREDLRHYYMYKLGIKHNDIELYHKILSEKEMTLDHISAELNKTIENYERESDSQYQSGHLTYIYNVIDLKNSVNGGNMAYDEIRNMYNEKQLKNQLRDFIDYYIKKNPKNKKFKNVYCHCMSGFIETMLYSKKYY